MAGLPGSDAVIGRLFETSAREKQLRSEPVFGCSTLAQVHLVQQERPLLLRVVTAELFHSLVDRSVIPEGELTEKTEPLEACGGGKPTGVGNFVRGDHGARRIGTVVRW